MRLWRGSVFVSGQWPRGLSDGREGQREVQRTRPDVFGRVCVDPRGTWHDFWRLSISKSPALRARGQAVAALALAVLLCCPGVCCGSFAAALCAFPPPLSNFNNRLTDASLLASEDSGIFKPYAAAAATISDSDVAATRPNGGVRRLELLPRACTHVCRHGHDAYRRWRALHLATTR